MKGVSSNSGKVTTSQPPFKSNECVYETWLVVDGNFEAEHPK